MFDSKGQELHKGDLVTVDGRFAVVVTDHPVCPTVHYVGSRWQAILGPETAVPVVKQERIETHE